MENSIIYLFSLIVYFFQQKAHNMPIFLKGHICTKWENMAKKFKAMVEALDLSPEETDKKSLVECLKQHLQ